MTPVLSLRAHALSDGSADAIVASTGRKLLAFVAWPFSIVMTMPPQREREAAQIAGEFRTDLYPERERS